MASNDVGELREEIERLARELDQASSEKIQSAKYGLGLLEEKCMLQQKCEELETLYENAKHELEITQEVSHRYDSKVIRKIRVKPKRLCESVTTVIAVLMNDA